MVISDLFISEVEAENCCEFFVKGIQLFFDFYSYENLIYVVVVDESLVVTKIISFYGSHEKKLAKDYEGASHSYAVNLFIRL